MESIVAVVFNNEDTAYKALTELKAEQETYAYTIKQIGLMKKENGKAIPLQGIDVKNSTKNAAGTGGLVGGLLGILGGPIGILIGASVGAGVGATVKSAIALDGLELLEKTMEKMPDEDVILVALVVEAETIVLDHKLQQYEATVSRFDVEEIAREVREAQRLQEEMEKEARLKAKEEKKQQKKQAKEDKKKEKAEKKKAKKEN